MNRHAMVLSLIPNMRIFGDMLDGYFRDWKGAYDILPWGSDEYLFRPTKAYTSFCQALRSSQIGDQLCQECDAKFASLASKAGQPIHYICHAGLVDMAAPIKTGDECLATIFCGQRLPNLPSEWLDWPLADVDAAIRVVERYSNELGRDLLPLWYQADTITMHQVIKVKERLGALAAYLGETWGESLEAKAYRQEEKRRQREIRYIQRMFDQISVIPDAENEFWERVCALLDDLGQEIGASHLVILTSQSSGSDIDIPVLKAASGLPREWLGRCYPGDRAMFVRVAENGNIYESLVGQPEADTAAYQVTQSANPIVDRQAYLRLSLADGTLFLMGVFAADTTEAEKRFQLFREVPIIISCLSIISAAYQAVHTLAQQKRWMQKLSHEVLTTITPLTDSTNVCLQRIQSITNERERKRSEFKQNNSLSIAEWKDVEKRILRMRGAASDIEAMMRRMEWHSCLMKEAIRPEGIKLVRTLIACTTDKQVQATDEKLRIHVNESSIEPYEEMVKLDEGSFKRVVWNILDNAIKYSASGTEIRISGELKDRYLIITISNIGYPILEEETDLVFEARWRAPLTAEKAQGHGLGLSYARDIMRRHGGDIRVSPSRLVTSLGVAPEQSYLTKFEILIPAEEPEK